MALSTISARIDSADKLAFDAFCSNVGLNTSAAITLFIKAVLRENKIPFEIAQDIPNPETRAALAEYKEMKNNKFAYPRYDSFDDLLSAVAEDVDDYKIK